MSAQYFPCGCDADSKGSPPGEDGAASLPHTHATACRQLPQMDGPRALSHTQEPVTTPDGSEVCTLSDISSFTYLGQPGGRKRELQMTGWDGNFATEQTRHKVSVTSLIIQTTEHKDNSFKYILVRVFDRNRYAISHEGGRRQHHTHAWHKLLVLSTLKMEKWALVRQQCCTCPMPCTSFLYAADVKKRILTIKLQRVLKGGEGGGETGEGATTLPGQEGALPGTFGPGQHLTFLSVR